MVEPQKIAIASLAMFVLGTVILVATFFVPGLYSSNEFSITIVVGLVLMILAGLVFLLQVAPIRIDYNMNISSFKIRGPYFEKEIPYSDISAIEYREFVLGMPLIALKSFEGIIGGLFRSPEVGMYHVVGFNLGKGTKFILIETLGGKIVAFNLESEEETQAVYGTITSKVRIRRATIRKKSARHS